MRIIKSHKHYLLAFFLLLSTKLFSQVGTDTTYFSKVIKAKSARIDTLKAKVIIGASTGSSSWGGITGALEDQVDLYTELTSINVNVSGKIPYSDTTTLLGVYLKKIDTSTLSARINQKVDTSSWVDYSSTSTINGFSSYTTKKIQYKKLDNNTLIVQYQIEGTGTNSTHSFTIPFSSSSWGTQYFIGHTVNNGTTQAAGSITLPASSSTVTVNNAASTTASWANATTQAMRGTLTININ